MDLDNIKESARELKTEYTVAQDNQRNNWRAYLIAIGPPCILIDKQGNIRYTPIGEGAFRENEVVIEALMVEPFPKD